MRPSKPGKPARALPLGRAVCADNLDFTRALPDACCQLIYADPPFMTGRRRGDRADAAPGYEDAWGASRDQYLAFMCPRLEEMRRLLAESGSLYVHLDYRAAAYVRVELDRIFGGRNFLNEIIWSYRSGGRPSRWFARKHDTILFYARSAGRHCFHDQREGWYRTDGLRQDSTGRPFKKTRRGPVYFNPQGPQMTDVWHLPFLSTVAAERTGYPTQKPLKLLERIIRASSSPGDVVADFFCGSGTTAVAALRLGRRFLCCDASIAAIRVTRDRLRRQREVRSVS